MVVVLVRVQAVMGNKVAEVIVRDLLGVDCGDVGDRAVDLSGAPLLGSFPTFHCCCTISVLLPQQQLLKRVQIKG